MLAFRTIPVVLIRGNGVVKGRQFQDHQYVGDPVNVVRIYNDKEADEIFILDIGAG